MTKATTSTAPAPSDDTASPVSRRSRFARRRRILLIAVLLVVAGVAFLANYGPVQSYVDARSRLDKVANKVAALEAEKAELQAQLGKLTEVDYLETLAREELTYARAGEDVYIIAETAEDAITAAAEAALDHASEAGDGEGSAEAEAGAGGPGLLERLLTAFLGLF